MRISFSANLHYYPALGGGNKVNRRLLEDLAARGHTVRAVLPAFGPASRITEGEWLGDLARLGAPVSTVDGVHRFTLNRVAVEAVRDPSRLRAHLAAELDAFQPEVVIITSEDVSQNLLAAALERCPERVVYLVLTTSFLPFGPDSFFPGEARARLIGGVRGIAVMSDYLRRYLREWGGLSSTLVHMPIYDRGPFADLHDFSRGYVTMVNPCTIKGLPIFAALARRLPEVAFAAVPTWGTNAADRATLAALPNVTLLTPDENIDRIFGQTRLLVMPSLWAEAFGMTCVEAQLRGIPVVASDAGGLPEAKCGTDYVIPVAGIARYGDALDENLLPDAAVPPQDLAPWVDAVRRLIGDRPEYERQSVAARAAGHRYFESASVERFEEFLVASLRSSR